MTRHVAPLLALTLLALVPASAAAQARVHGIVRDSMQGTPLPQVEVLVEGMNLSALTDAAGSYSLRIPLGFHTVRFRRVGYHPVTRQLRLSNPDSVQLDLAMLDQAQRLDPVDVTAAAPPRTWPPGIDDRIKEGFGQFVTDSALRKFEHSRLSNVLQSEVSGVRFKRVNGRNIAFSRRGPRIQMGTAVDCDFLVWFDGILLGSGEDLDRYAIVNIEAVEVFHAAQIPSQYRGGNAACGVILLWSRTQRN